MIGFHDLYLEYLNEIRLRHDRKTYLEKKALGRRAFEAWGYVDVMEVNPSMVQRLLADRAEKVSKNAFNKDRKNFLAFFNWIKKMKGIDHNPVLSVERLAVERRPQPVPSEEDVVRLLVAADRHGRNLIVACCTTGGRRSEIFRWKWHEDINFEKRMVRLGTRKTRSGEMRYRWIRMNDMLYKALRDEWTTRLPQSDYVFQNRDPRHPRYGDRYTTRRKFMKGLCDKAGIEPFGFHALRRFFGSLLADKYKESVPVIQKLLGHASPTTTERYIFNISEDVKKAVDQINLKGFTHDIYTQKEEISGK